MLPHYGINWDTINHLPRGQAYLHFFLTGKRDYSDLPQYRTHWQNPQSLFIDTSIPPKEAHTRSYYQLDAYSFINVVDNDGNGHPPLSDILSSLFNYVFFQRLGIINDVDAYRLYGVFLSSLLVGIVIFWSSKKIGRWGSVIAGISLGMYPLFWSELHFNTEKDVPETVFITLTLFSIWQGFRARKAGWILLAGLCSGLALGTKFNILFAPVILAPWFLFLIFQKQLGWVFSHKRFLLAIIGAPLIAVIIFIASWPYLWADPLSRVSTVFSFYKTIGLTGNLDARFTTFLNINTYPLQWIVFTTPVPLLVGFAVGIFVALKRLKYDRDGFYLLVLLSLVVPIARVSWPGATIYGGVRQIMEYIPPFAILVGIGVDGVLKAVPKKLVFIAHVVIGVGCLTVLQSLYRIHPNENVYFNSLIGGLSGAKVKNIPFWGNSFGAAYREGVFWLNKNASLNAKVAYARELLPNFPKVWLRSDLSLHNSFRSGALKEGEYIIALTYEGTEKTSYFDRYLEAIVEPVYQVKVDDVAILKIWQNDLEHTKEEFRQEVLYNNFSVSREKSEVKLDLGKVEHLSRVEIGFQKKDDCAPTSSGFVTISENDKDWKRLPGNMPNEDWSVPKLGNQPRENFVLVPFAADKARIVSLKLEPSNNCILESDDIKIFVFPQK